MSKTIDFTKMQGAGNDYIYVDADRFRISDPAALSVRLSKPHTGIGSDGLILISRSRVADFRMRIFNADGSEAMMCGNGSRCVGKFVYDKGLTTKTTLTLETLAGTKTLRLHLSHGEVGSVSVDMGRPEILRLDGADIPFVNLPISTDGITMNGTAVSMGNPHLVFFVPAVEDIDIAEVGSKFERHPWFPDRTNVEFAQRLAPGRIRMRVWERGSGITMACGTGACATFVAARADGLASRKATVVVDGGELEIEESPDGGIIMTGPAQTVFEGRFTV